jgi:lipopolysaccharide transport system ATP-binding protein
MEAWSSLDEWNWCSPMSSNVDHVIVARELSKEYKLSALQVRHDTLRDHLAYGWKSFLRRGRRDSEGGFWALKNVSFSVRPSEVVGIIGPNGAGKSTLLKILSRITHPTSGSAVIRGRAASLLEVGTGFQPELSGRENIYLSGAILGMRKIEISRHFDEIVDFSGIEKFIDTPVKRYSSGMYVRLAFAVAAHLEPEVMFIDEVLAVGDAGFQKKCLAKMGDVARGGRTILFVSHNLAAVRSLCPRSLFLHGGEIASDGPSDEVITRYLADVERDELPEQRPRIAGDAAFVEGSEDFFLHPKDQNAIISVLCGEPIVVEFDVESPKTLNDATAGVLVMSSTGEKIVAMSSKVQNIQTHESPSRFWRVRCDMGRLPLNAGTYFAQIHFGNGMVDVARFSGAFKIKVAENDVFGWGNGLPPQSAWGSVYWAPNWHIAAVESVGAEIADVVAR